jgi:hypothetical protein
MHGKHTMPMHKVVKVTIANMEFSPAVATVNAGDTIEWTNRDVVQHTATASNRAWDVSIAAGKTGRAVVSKAGRVEYYCKFHPTCAQKSPRSSGKRGAGSRSPAPHPHSQIHAFTDSLIHRFTNPSSRRQPAARGSGRSSTTPPTMRDDGSERAGAQPEQHRHHGRGCADAHGHSLGERVAAPIRAGRGCEGSRGDQRRRQQHRSG